MGSEARVDFIKATGDKDTPQDAYLRASYEAQLDNGSRGYTGSIAEANGWVAAGTTPVLKWEAETLGDRLIREDRVEKWGPCTLIPVAQPAALNTIEMTVDVTGHHDWQKVNEMCADAVRTKMRQGEQIESLRIEEGETKTKVVTETTQGSAVTRYAISDGNQWHYFLTLTAAKEWASEQLARKRWSDTYAIIKKTTRETGEPLVVVKRVPTKITKKVTAKVGKPVNGAVAGWVAAGIYSC